MVLGALVARRLGHRKVLMIAENGQLAIHLPLNNARVGAFSTHTAHPDVLALMQRILRTALSVNFELLNPYVYRTKGEVVDGLGKTFGIAFQSRVAVGDHDFRKTRPTVGSASPAMFGELQLRHTVWIQPHMRETYFPKISGYLRQLTRPQESG